MRIVFPLILMLATFAAPVQAQRDSMLMTAIQQHEAALQPPLLDRDAFLQQARLEIALLSPDGTYVAFIVRDGLEAHLQLLDTQTLQTETLLKSVRLRGFSWSENGKSLILDMGGAVGVLHLTQRDSPSWVVMPDKARPFRFLGSDLTTAGGILVVRDQDDDTQVLQRIDFNGATTDVAATADYIDSAMLSADGTEVFLITNTAEQHNVVHVHNGEATTLMTCPIIVTCTLIAYEDASDTLWLTAPHESDLRQLVAIKVSEKRITAVHSDPQGTVDAFSTSQANTTPRVVQYRNGNVQNYGLDAIAQSIVEKITAQFPNDDLTLTLDSDAETWLVRHEASDFSEPRFHLFHRSTGVFDEILAGTRNPLLPDNMQLSRKLPIDYRGTDGRMLHGYVTLPKGVRIADAPLVAVIHGGPWGRVYSVYSAYTQLLANRGYIVFEPNFRASTGYGLDYITAANRDFGNGVVQQDITDGVRFLLDNGVGNRDRVGIAGASFGGFSVLAGLAFTPEIYKVGVAAVPPADMSESLRKLVTAPTGGRQQDPAGSGMLKILLGNFDDAADLERLYRNSPQASLSTITAPLLVMAGADDDRVSIDHVKDYSLELVNLGKQITLLIDEDEGHGFTGGHSMAAYYYLTELMLGEYLQGRVQPLRPGSVASYLERKLLLRAGPLQAAR